MHVSVTTHQPNLIITRSAVEDPIDDYQTITIQISSPEAGLLLTIKAHSVTSVETVTCRHKPIT